MGIELAIIGATLGGIAAGAGATALAGGFSKPKPPALPPPPKAPSLDDAEAKGRQEAIDRRRRQTQTILTSPLGLPVSEQGTKTKTLLGE